MDQLHQGLDYLSVSRIAGRAVGRVDQKGCDTVTFPPECPKIVEQAATELPDFCMDHLVDLLSESCRSVGEQKKCGIQGKGEVDVVVLQEKLQ